MLVVFALAQAISATVEVNNDALTFKVNYDKLRDNDRKLSVDQKITLTNKGTSTESITLGLQDMATDYELNVNPTSLQLASGASQDITVSGKVPTSTDEGTKNIGKLKLTTTLGQSSLLDLKSDVQSMLEIKKIVVYVNEQDLKNINQDDERVRNLEPGDNIELHFQLENLFDSDYDRGDISGTIGIVLDDSDFKGDVDEEESFDVDAGQKLDSKDDEVVLKFIVPGKVNSGDYVMDIKMNGKDGNKAKYETKWKLNLEVNRKKDDVRIETLTATPSEVSCFRKVDLVAKVTNFGENSQKHAGLSLINSNLGLNLKQDMELQKGTADLNTQTKLVTLDLENKLAPGTYPIVATAFVDYNAYSDKKVVNVVVKACTAESKNITIDNNIANSSEKEKLTSSTSESNTPIMLSSDKKNTSPAVEENIETVKNSVVVQTIENPYTTKDYLFAGVLVAIILVLAMIVLFVLLLVKPRH